MNQLHKEDATVDVLVDVSQQTNQQFQRIYNALAYVDDDHHELARKCQLVKDYANSGIRYTEGYLQKYTREQINEGTTMPEPKDLPDRIVGAPGRSTTLVLPSLEESPVPDMDFTMEFVQQWLKTNNQVSRIDCYKEGVKQRHYKNVKDHKSVKSLYYGRRP